MSNLSKFTPTFSKRKAQIEQPEPSKSRLLCHVGDCDRIGTFSESAGPDAKFVCWVHDRVRSEDNQRLNDGVHNYPWLLKLCDKITTIPKIDLEISDSAKQVEINSYCESRGIPEMARIKNTGQFPKYVEWEPQINWVSRFRNFTVDVLLGRKEIGDGHQDLRR